MDSPCDQAGKVNNTNQVMDDQELIELLLDTDEWSMFDCKRAAIEPSKLLEAIVALANTEGGSIVVGLEDPRKAESNKRLIGISEKPNNISEFLKLLEKEIEPPLIDWKTLELSIINIYGQYSATVF